MAKQDVKSSKKDQLDAVCDQINKKYGTGTVFKLSDSQGDYEGYPTGSIGLDKAIGGHGWPKGRLIEIYGPQSTGKSTLALATVKEVQNAGGTAAYIDAENALDLDWANKIGVKTSELDIIQPSSAEQALQICNDYIMSGKTNIIIIDSVAALTPKNEIEGDIGDVHVASLARIMGQAIRKFTSEMNRNKVTVILINQIRNSINTFGFGSNEYTPGGNGIKFAASVRVDLRRIKTLGEKELSHGIRVKAKVVKNKCAAPFREAEYEIHYAHGIMQASEVYDLGIEHGIIEKMASSFGPLKWRGREDALELLHHNPFTLAEILKLAKTKEAEKQKRESEAKERRIKLASGT